jgi:hypothetical protein
LKISFFENAEDNEPKAAEVDWPQLAKSLGVFRRTQCSPCKGHDCPQKNGLAWSPVEYAPDAPRGLRGVLKAHALVLDLDKATEESIAKVDQALEGLEYVIHSSHSFTPEGVWAFRIILPLTQPVPAQQWGKFWDGVVSAFEIPVDTHCRDISRIYFAPSAPEGAPTFYHHQTGQFLDPELILGQVAQSATSAPKVDVTHVEQQPIDLSELREGLKKLTKKSSKAKDTSKELARKILAGDPLAAPGGRDGSLNAAAGLVVFASPSSAPIDALFGLLQPSLCAMDLEPEGFEYWRAEVMDQLQRARERKLEVEDQERETFDAIRESVKQAVGLREPETAEEEDAPAGGFKASLAYVKHWDRFVPRTGDGSQWDIAQNLTHRAAKVHVVDNGDLNNALEFVEPGSPMYEALNDFKEMPFHPLTVVVSGFDVQPGGGGIVLDDKKRPVLNLWVPPTLQAEQGEFKRIKALIDYLTANEGVADPGGANWIIHWMAAKLQKPGNSMLTSPVFHGTPGNGKGTLARIMKEMIGPDNYYKLNQGSLGGDFNSHYANKLFVFADECIPAGSMKGITETLKDAITGDTIDVNTKGVPRYEVKNRIAWMFASNNENPIVVEKDDRRFSVFSNRAPLTDELRSFFDELWVPSENNKPTEIFWAEMRAFKHYLENLQVDYKLIRSPYKNIARQDVINANLPSQEVFVQEVEEVGFENMAELMGGVTLCSKGKQKDKAAPDAWTFHFIYLVYKKYCEDRGYRFPCTQIMLGKTLKRHAWQVKKVPATVYWAPEKTKTVEPPDVYEVTMARAQA